MLLSPIVALNPASDPRAMLLLLVLLLSARLPTAVFELPVMLPESASHPVAVLLLPMVLLRSAPPPGAAFNAEAARMVRTP